MTRKPFPVAEAASWRHHPTIRVECLACGEVLFRWPYELRKHPNTVCGLPCLMELRRRKVIKCGGQKPIPDRGSQRWCSVCKRWHHISAFGKRVKLRLCVEAHRQLDRESRMFKRRMKEMEGGAT